MPNTLPSYPPLKDGDLLAAIDLGSNSFHMVVARYLLGQLHVVDRLREAVRIADGLDAKGGLSSKACERALECLARFGQRLRNMPSPHVRALATNTVRRLRSPQAFLVLAETALGHSIEVVSGREEARLIYLGVAHAQPPRLDQHRLVIDIGGGSTEFIIGKGFEPLERESLQVGCIASTRRFFPEGKLSKKRWNDALTEIGTEFQQFAAQYNVLGWQEALGSSGTHKTIAKICTEMKLAKGEITAEALPVLREELLKAKRIEDIHLPGLSAHRRPIIAGGILVLEAVFQTLGLEKLLVSKAAMREGILYDMLGRAGDNDPRDTSVAVLMHRYAIDEQQALRVETTAQLLFQQACGPWALDADDARVLCWAARLHELGLVIAHSHYHVHGSYVLEHSDIAGFSRQEQQVLAVLVCTHRRHVSKNAFDVLPDRLRVSVRRRAALLRLAALLHRAREPDWVPTLNLHVDGDVLMLTVPKGCLASRPLLHSDLNAEVEAMVDLGIVFKLSVV